MNLDVIKVTDKIIRLHFETAKDMCETFIRFQEHYEGPTLQGKIFTLGQVREDYAERHGAFTYNDDWSGMNIPDYVLTPFLKGSFDPLTPNEQTLLFLFRDRQGPFYIIGTYENGKLSTIDHEIAHGLYYTNKDYRSEVMIVLRETTGFGLDPLYKWLLDKGYHRDVFQDEVHAYISIDPEFVISLGCGPDYVKRLHNLLKPIYDKYGPKSNQGSEV